MTLLSDRLRPQIHSNPTHFRLHHIGVAGMYHSYFQEMGHTINIHSMFDHKKGMLIKLQFRVGKKTTLNYYAVYNDKIPG